MAYTSKYKQAEIEAILDAKNNTGAGVDATLDGLFIDALQTKDVELSESAEITPDDGYLGLKKVNVSVKGGGGSEGGNSGEQKSDIAYYKFIHDKELSIPEFSEEPIPSSYLPIMLPMIFTYVKITSLVTNLFSEDKRVIYNTLDLSNSGYVEESLTLEGFLCKQNIGADISKIYGFSIIRDKTSIVFNPNLINQQIIEVIEGGFTEKIINCLTEQVGQEMPQSVIDAIKETFVEVSKEEYLALVNN